MNRADIVAELERIAALLGGAGSADDLGEARRGLAALAEAVRLGEVSDPDECPFEPGRVRLVALQSRSKPSPPRTKKKTAKTPPKRPAGEAATPRRAGDGRPLTGRIAGMVRDGVPTEAIVALYRVKPEHVDAFVAAFVTPARARAAAAGCDAGPLTRCPTPT